VAAANKSHLTNSAAANAGDVRPSSRIDLQFPFFAATRRGSVASYRVASIVIRSKGPRFNAPSENKFILRPQTLSFHRHPVIQE
jgi:hypothetical protein